MKKIFSILVLVMILVMPISAKEVSLRRTPKYICTKCGTLNTNVKTTVIYNETYRDDCIHGLRGDDSVRLMQYQYDVSCNECSMHFTEISPIFKTISCLGY